MDFTSDSTSFVEGIILPSSSHEEVNDNSADLRTVRQWPVLSDLAMSSSKIAARRLSIGGSDANVIASGDPAKVLNLWREKRGEAEPADLSDRVSVFLGCWTEPFNRQWFERICNQQVTRVGEVLTCAKQPWRTCTLDGFVVESGAIWEAKHTSAFTNPDEVLTRYMPQLQHSMAVAGVGRAVLSVIFGNHKFEFIEVASDWLYQAELLDAEADFWDCVQTGRVPVAADPPPPPKALAVREICLEGNNCWASAACDWLQHRDGAKKHAAATAAIKGLVEEDVKRVFGHGIEAKRSKSGAITIKELA